MHSTGSAILTILERARYLLDDPSADAKILNDLMVRQHVAPSYVDIMSRLHNTSGCRIVNRLTITFVTGRKDYPLPPCVQEIVDVVVVDSQGDVIGRVNPRDPKSYHGPNWTLEGTPGNLIFRMAEAPLTIDSLQVWYISNGDVAPHYSAAGGAANSYIGDLNAGGTWTESTKTINGTNIAANYTHYDGAKIRIAGGTGVTPGDYEIASKTDADNLVLRTSIGSGADGIGDTDGWLLTNKVDLATTPTAGMLDRRDSAYIGQIFRFLPTTGRVQSSQITAFSWNESTWTVTLRTPIDVGSAGTTLRYEIVPEGATAVCDAIAARAAQKIGTGMKISQSHQKDLLREYRMAMKTIGDNLTNIQTIRNPKFHRSRDDNTLVAWPY